MLECIWHKTKGMSVVETDEFNKLMATGDYFDNPFELQQIEDQENETHENKPSPTRRRSRHNLQSSVSRDDSKETSCGERVSRIRRRDDEHRGESPGVCSEIDEGNWPRVSSEVKEDTQNASAEDSE